MPRLSIIIAAPHDCVSLEETLLSVLENRPDDCEILVAHPSSYRDPYSLAGEVEFVATPAGSPALACWQAGLAHSQGEIVHFLRAGCEVAPGWAGEAALLFADRKMASVTPVVFEARARNRLVAVGIADAGGFARTPCGAHHMGSESLVQRLKPLGPMLDASFYRRTALDAAAGLPTAVGEVLADLDLAYSLAALGFRTAVAGECHVYMPVPQSRESAFQAARNHSRLFWRQVAARRFVTGSLRHATRCLIEALRQPLAAPLRLAGHLAAQFEAGSLRRHQQALDAKAEELLAGVRLETASRLARFDGPHRGTAPHETSQPLRRKAS